MPPHVLCGRVGARAEKEQEGERESRKGESYHTLVYITCKSRAAHADGKHWVGKFLSHALRHLYFLLGEAFEALFGLF